MKYKPYPKYKDSGVEWLGEIPEGWSLSYAKRLFANKKVPQLESDEQLTASQKYGVIPQRLFMEKADQKVALALSGTESFKHVDSDDFIISLRSFEGGIERAFYSGCITPAYTVISAVQEIYPDYWAHCLKSSGFISMLSTLSESLRDGKAINYESFGKAVLPLPSISTQRAIASFLDSETARLDGLIQDYENLIELLKEKRQALISRAVTCGLSELVSPDDPEFGEWAKPVKFKDSGVEWIGEIPEGWEAGALKKWLSVVDCKHLTAEFVDSGYALVSIRELQGHVVDISEAKHTTVEYFNKLIDGGRELRKRDLVFCRNVGVGQVSIVPEMPNECAMGQDVCRLRPLGPNTDSSFILLVLKSASIVSQLESIMIGATFKRVNVEQIRELCVTSPDIEEQHAIASFLDRETDKIDTLVAESESAIELLKEHRSALITNAVTGKIDVEGFA